MAGNATSVCHSVFLIVETLEVKQKWIDKVKNIFFYLKQTVVTQFHNLTV